MADLQSLRGEKRVQRASVEQSVSPIWPSGQSLGATSLFGAMSIDQSMCPTVCKEPCAKSKDDKMNIF